jgi:bacteriorhodopsin
VLVLIWGPLRSEAVQGQTRDTNLFFPLAGILSVLWTLYPIVWLLGTEGGGVVGSSVEVFFFAVLDILAKVGFGFYLIGGVRRNAEQGFSGTGGARSARGS